MREEVESGSPLWRALEAVRIFPTEVISLIRVGESAGRLIENLRVVAIQQQKQRVFRSKIKSALMYPVFVLGLTLVVGIVVAWFILPRLAQVFRQLNVELPFITRQLMILGNFLGQYGSQVMPPLIVALAIIFYLVFFYSRTKFVGEWLLLRVPGVKRLLKEAEIGRFGYIFGSLLQAGLPIVEAMTSLKDSTVLADYRRLYIHLEDGLINGQSLQKSFSQYRGISSLIPLPILQMIAAGEQSGKLPETLVKIGLMFEEKTELTTKNLTVILEPVLLVIVWLGVVAVALAVIMPIYSLIGGLR